MPKMEVWDWVLCIGTAFAAVSMLVRQMLARREWILDEMGWRAELEQRRKRLDTSEQVTEQAEANRRAG